MAYDRQSLRWSMLYHIDGTEEVAVTSVHTSGATGWAGAEAALADLDMGDVENLATLWLTQHEILTYQWANYSVFDGIKVAAIDVAGHYLGAPRLYEDTAPTSGEDGFVLPQATVVASLRSPSAVGEANYGRMYLPHSMLTPQDVTPFGSIVRAQELATWMAGWIAALGVITESLSSPSLPVIMSSKGAGTAKAITRVAVDTVTDTQRRRRNRLIGSYQFTDVP